MDIIMPGSHIMSWRVSTNIPLQPAYSFSQVLSRHIIKKTKATSSLTCHFPKRWIPGLLLLFCPLLKLWCEAPFLLADLTEARLSQHATHFKEVIISSLTTQSLYLFLWKVHKFTLIVVRPTISSYSKFLPNEERTLHPKAQMYPNAASHLFHLPCRDVIPGSLPAIIS